MTTLKGLFKLEKLSFALATFTLFATALTRLLPFEWMERAAQWGVLTLLIAFILGCATLCVVGIASVLPREQQRVNRLEVSRDRPQPAPAFAFAASAKTKKHR